jgi:hypothetical protein
MTDQELKDLVASLAVDTQRMKAEAERRAQETDRYFREMKAEAERRAQETDRYFREMKAETDRQIRELGKQIGGLGNKFGSFTEGLAMPSVKQILLERFGVEAFFPYPSVRAGEKSIELDALGVVNGARNEAYIVEIKSHLRQDGVEQLLETLKSFRSFFPEYANKKLYGVITAAHASKEALALARKAGLYVLTFEDNLLRFHDEDGFAAKAY